jgi:branched-chain amino acid transport system permease protein
VLLGGMTVLIRKTMLGIHLRASTEDFRMAQLSGVRANWVISSAFAITGLLASAVAVLYTFRVGAVAPDMGQGPLLIAFVGGVIGGLGSLPAAALGGFVLGVVINALQALLPLSINSHTQLFAFAVVIAILVFQPDGLGSIRGRAARGWWRRLRGTPAAEGASG